MLKSIEDKQMKKRPDVQVGDTVKLHLKIKEGAKQRKQVFEGVVIGIKGTGINCTVTVRKISYGVGVEKIIPLHSPLLEKIEIVKRGSVRKSKLYFLRERIGKRALKINKLEDVYMTDEVEEIKETPEEEIVKES